MDNDEWCDGYTPHDGHLRELHERYNKRHISLVARSHLAIKMSTHIYHMISKRELYKFHEDMCKDKMSKLNTLSGNWCV